MTTQNLKLELTLMVNADYHGGTRLEITDTNSHIQFAEILITEEQLVRLLSRQAGVKCDAKIRNIDNVGKRRETREFVFEVSEWKERDEAERKAKELCPDGWEPSLYFGSQSSFFTGKDKKRYAKTYMYRYVDVGESDENT